MEKTNHRASIVAATARLMAEGGYAAMRTEQIIAMSKAPKGSLYYYFPGGKEEMAVAAIGSAGDDLAEVMRRNFAETKTVKDGLEETMNYVRGLQAVFGHTVSCAVAGLAAEAPKSRILGRRVTGVFDQWEEILGARLIKAGATRKRAAELATFVLATIEGAILLSKARRSGAPVDTAMAEIARVLKNEGIA